MAKFAICNNSAVFVPGVLTEGKIYEVLRDDNSLYLVVRNDKGTLNDYLRDRFGDIFENQDTADYDALRLAALKMQVAVAAILEVGGTEPGLWWDGLIEAQRELAGKTKGKSAEFKKIRDEKQ